MDQGKITTRIESLGQMLQRSSGVPEATSAANLSKPSPALFPFSSFPTVLLEGQV